MPSSLLSQPGSFRMSSKQYCMTMALLVWLLAILPGNAEPVAAPKVAFPFKDGDRVAWIGSSSTAIGVWPKTIEFLLRTRHPDLNLEFKRFTTGGGTFATGLQKLDGWLEEYKPTVVLFNYGGNDAVAGEKGLPKFKEQCEQCVAKAKAAGARPLLMTPQAADIRKAGEKPAGNRKLYAEEMIGFAKEKGWPVIDTHHPLQNLQDRAQKDSDAYTILKDNIHLTEPAYIGWGYFLYEQLNAPTAVSTATLTAKGEVRAATGCQISDAKADGDGLSFVRADAVLPILPPVALPPRKYVPLELLSPYNLKIEGLSDGMYAIRCEGKPIGMVSAKSLAEGVNLNTLLLDSQNAAPWEALAKDLWAGKALDQIGKTKWQFEVKKQ
jgi:lysophospholipase L1-like esterase